MKLDETRGSRAVTKRTNPAARCPECGRRFDLTDEADADEFFNGHDCEVEG